MYMKYDKLKDIINNVNLVIIVCGVNNMYNGVFGKKNRSSYAILFNFWS